MTSGLLLIDKPEGLRSTECVGKVRRAFGRGVRVGHAGTLDSTASGLLVVLVGGATRLSDCVMELPKVYRARVRLGLSTDTCDYTGTPVFCGDVSRVDEAALDRALCSFLGARFQVPPGISALKVGGQPAHRLTRAGREVSLASRLVVMTSVRRLSPLKDGEVTVEIACGKGVYVRSVARDLGELLGCGAHLAGLRRLSIGPFAVSDAVPPFFETSPPELRRPQEAIAFFQRIAITEEAERRLLQGLSVPLSEAGAYVPGRLELSKGFCVEGAGMIGFVEPFKEAGKIFLKPKANIRLETEGAS